MKQEGLTAKQASEELGVKYATLRHWWYRKVPTKPRPIPPPTVMSAEEILQPEAYAYILGLYLGDGHIVQSKHRDHLFVLRIFQDANYVRLCHEAQDRLQDLFPHLRPSIYWPKHGSKRGNVAIISIYRKHLTVWFPQHGAGRKHKRLIVLEEWQREITHAHPLHFLRGLIHSDGCRYINWVNSRGRRYEYPAYSFSNMSQDIHRLFQEHCDIVGVAYTTPSAKCTAVRNKPGVQMLDLGGCAKA